MALIVRSGRVLYRNALGGPCFELGVRGADSKLRVLIARQFENEIPGEAYVTRVGEDKKHLILFPQRNPRPRKHVFVMDQLAAIDRDEVLIDTEASYLTLVNLEANDTPVLTIGGKKGFPLGFAILLASGDRMVSKPIGEEGFRWVLRNEGGRVRKNLLSPDEYEVEFNEEDALWTPDEVLSRFGYGD